SVFYYVSSQALHPSSYKSIKTPIRKITFTLHLLNICNKKHFLQLLSKKKPKIEHASEKFSGVSTFVLL
ncbi:hypothetical protein ACPTHB_15500, partial [Enterococcus faecalis]